MMLVGAGLCWCRGEGEKHQDLRGAEGFSAPRNFEFERETKRKLLLITGRFPVFTTIIRAPILELYLSWSL